MKRGILISLLVLILPIVSAVPPSFHIYEGYVYCGDTLVSDKILDITYYNVSDWNMNGWDEITIVNGKYQVLVEAYLGYNVSFFANLIELEDIAYVPYGLTELNFTVDPASDYCYIPVVNPPGSGGTTGGGGDECGDNSVNQDWEECDGTDLNDETCASLGFDSGVLRCYPAGHSSECEFNTTACVGALPECGDGTCDVGENCFTCYQDCGVCGNNQIDLTEVNDREVTAQETAYQIIFSDGEYIFNVVSVSNEKVQLLFESQTYDVVLGQTRAIDFGAHNVGVNYVSYQDGTARVSFSKMDLRQVVSYNSYEVLYFLGGGIVFVVLIFFFVRWLGNRSKPQNLTGTTNLLGSNK